MQKEFDCVVQGADILGEVPLWCERTRKLWWVDVRRPAIQTYDPATAKHTAHRLNADMATGSIALREAGGLLLATNSGFYTYDPEKPEAPQSIGNPEAHLPQHRMNDGKVDRRGRFWVGSMKDGVREPAGNVYRLDADHQSHFQFGGIHVPNSISWSPDSRTMYFADTHLQLIWAYDFDLDDGVMSKQRVFKDWSGSEAKPDGSERDGRRRPGGAPDANRQGGPRDPAADQPRHLPRLRRATTRHALRHQPLAAFESRTSGARTVCGRPVCLIHRCKGLARIAIRGLNRGLVDSCN